MSIAVTNLDRARRFYDAVLASLGYHRVNDLETQSGYGPDRDNDNFYISLDESNRSGKPSPAAHVAFAAPDRSAVTAFYRAALEAGAVDDGPPGLRLQYHANYYAAYAIDPDGNRIEAVCHQPGEG